MKHLDKVADMEVDFFISDTGEIITNMHVIDQAQSVWIKIPSLGKEIIPVEVIGKAPERDSRSS